MKSSTLLKLGITGTIITTLCCFTPALVILLGLLGLSAWTGHLDTILLPTLGVFIVITLYSFIRNTKAVR